jgi:hypothetical protein
MRVLTIVVVAMLFSSVAAQVCTTELQRALPGADASPGQVAASLLAEAVRLVEPALPSSRTSVGPVDEAGAAADAVTFLHQRRLLPDGWSPEGHTPEAWAAMLARFAAAYRLPPPEASGADTRAMLQDAGRTVEIVGRAVRPLPVFAVGPDGAITLFTVIWNWTSYPRLLVFRPSEGLRLGEGPSREAAAAVLDAMSTCAIDFDLYVYADESDALRLFVDQGSSTLRLLAAEPLGPAVPTTFEGDAVVDVLTYRAPSMAGVDVMSVAIEGPSPGAGTIASILTRVRTNVGLTDLMDVLALP